jgi:hypothetical protein
LKLNKKDGGGPSGNLNLLEQSLVDSDSTTNILADFHALVQPFFALIAGETRRVVSIGFVPALWHPVSALSPM